MNEARKLLAGWVAAIADNVKNPIASLAVTFDQLENNLDEPEAIRASIAFARDRLATLNDYVNELTEFAHPSLLTRSHTAIKPVIAEAIQAARLPPVCRIDCRVADTTSGSIDAKRLMKALKALLRNAYEAVDTSRTPRILIAAETLSDGVLLISVEDNGPGLSALAARDACEPFFTTKEAGTGLGLTIAKKCIEDLGGSLTITRSTDLDGCRVELLIPSSNIDNLRPQDR